VTVTAYVQPAFIQYALGNKAANLTTDTLNVGLIGTTGLAARGTSEGYRYVSDLLANSGSALTEVSTSGTGYTRQSLSGVSWGTSALVVTFTATNPSWAAASFSTYYAWLHDETDSSGTDATRPLFCIWDLGGVQTVTAATFTLAVNASGLVTFTMAA
jgi:hypothetical protein